MSKIANQSLVLAVSVTVSSLLATPLPARAQSVALVTGNDYAPFTHNQLPEGGMATEIVRKALAASKMEPTIAWLPWSRGYDETKGQKFAGTFPYVHSPERDQDFVFSKPIYELKQHAFTRADSKLDFAQPSSLAGSTICLPTGWAPAESLAEMIKSGQIKREEARDISFCVRMVISGRADYFITAPFQGVATIKGTNTPAGTLQMSPTVLNRSTLHLIAAKSSPTSNDVIGAFNRGLEALQKSGEYDKIVDRHIKAAMN